MKKRLLILSSTLLLSIFLCSCDLVPFSDDLSKFSGVKEQSKSKDGDSSIGNSENDDTDYNSESNVSDEVSLSKKDKAIFNKAKICTDQYNYDKSIELLKSIKDYDNNPEIMEAIKKNEEIKSTLVEYPLDKITHVFYHSLIVDPKRAFDGDSKEAGYNQVMTTISEFNKITDIMYKKGYVLVSPHDMAKVNSNGEMEPQKIMLPPGKIPFVLSQDDVSYYHFMDGDGFASKLVLDKNGKVKCLYVDENGNKKIGDYDLVPLLDDFIKKHPDFSYHGRKGILAMTGYDGVLGYRTDIAYKTKENLQDNQKEFLKKHPKFNFEKDCKEAKAVADAMKAEGWEFASHTWGHRNATTSTAEELQVDNEKWEESVAPILGKTDMIIFAFGADIGDWNPYTYDNPKFSYYKSRGYNYYCNVDASQYWVQITKDYFRQGRRNLDGYRMYYNPDMLKDLFDVNQVWDKSRPTPVPQM